MTEPTPAGSESGDFDDRTVGLAEYWLEAIGAGSWPDRKRQKALADARRVVSHLQRHLDDQPIEEAIGRCRELDERPTSANYLLTTVRNWAAERDIEIPELAG